MVVVAVVVEKALIGVTWSDVTTRLSLVHQTSFKIQVIVFLYVCTLYAPLSLNLKRSERVLCLKEVFVFVPAAWTQGHHGQLQP